MTEQDLDQSLGKKPPSIEFPKSFKADQDNDDQKIDIVNLDGKNLVIVGANGSGKTKLGTWLQNRDHQFKQNILKSKIHQDKNIFSIHRISAHRKLAIPTLTNTITILDEAALKFYMGNSHVSIFDSNDYLLSPLFSKYRDSESANIMCVDDFTPTIEYLLSINSNAAMKIKSDLNKDILKKKEEYFNEADRVIEIWNKIMPYRQIFINDQSRLMVKSARGDVEYYSASLSDGERGALYLICQCILSKKSSIVIIDEPELHLHKAIISKLWDLIEEYCSDKLLIYITHDLDFAVSRTNSKKIWLKEYHGNDNWEYEELDKYLVNSNLQDLPEKIILELLGNRNPILFCEGNNTSLDVRLYKVVYPDYFIKPVGSCENVISYTKTWNKQQNNVQRAFGIIDRDFRTEEEINSFKKEGIFVLDFAATENIFFDIKIIQYSLNKFFPQDNSKVQLENIITKVIELVNNDLLLNLKTQCLTERINRQSVGHKLIDIIKNEMINSILKNQSNDI